MYHFDHLEPAIRHLLAASDAIRGKISAAEAAGLGAQADTLLAQHSKVLDATEALQAALALTPDELRR